MHETGVSAQTANDACQKAALVAAGDDEMHRRVRLADVCERGRGQIEPFNRMDAADEREHERVARDVQPIAETGRRGGRRGHVDAVGHDDDRDGEAERSKCRRLRVRRRMKQIGARQIRALE